MWKCFSGYIRYHIICADCVMLLNALNSSEIILEDVVIINDLEFQITVYNKENNAFLKICKKMGASVKILQKNGLMWEFGTILKRPVLMGMLSVLLILFFYLPSRVLFISVVGNKNIPTNQILEAAESCGIFFGANRREVRSEQMKNALLQKIPQLQWAGINTSGCTAIISVEEKTINQNYTENKNVVSSIIASTDGIIQSCTVYQGNQLCSVGQAVKAGQTLVSGYTDCGVITKTAQAKAEISALTFREIEAYSSYPAKQRGEFVRSETFYSLQIGKKRIKFYKDSGNYRDSCVKIYEEKYMGLPGGFLLPIAIVKEIVLWHNEVTEDSSAADSCEWFKDSVRTCLKNEMIAGKIVSEETEITLLNDAYFVYGRYACMEMIGQVKYEQTIIED